MLTIGIELPSLSLRLGIGVWMFAMVASDLVRRAVEGLGWRVEESCLRRFTDKALALIDK